MEPLVSEADSQQTLRTTPLAALHQARGARMVPFAGYSMPLHYPSGILEEHRHVRRRAGLFDVSHMGQARLAGADAAVVLERLSPGGYRDLAPGRMRYGVLTAEDGGILDDLMVTAEEDGSLYLVVNAARKALDFARLQTALGQDVTFEVLDDQALLALQGPAAARVLETIFPGVAALRFLEAARFVLEGAICRISRSGYTGEDGFEISVPAVLAESLAERLLADEEAAPIGLGARDSLRLEAGLCLYGHDLDETVTPGQARLGWCIPRRRREEGGFPGAARILAELAEGPARLRVGLRIDGRAPLREGAPLHRDREEPALGRVTSGGFSPTLGLSIAMGYVPAALSEPGTRLFAPLRGRWLEAEVVSLPFVTHRYVRNGQARNRSGDL